MSLRVKLRCVIKARLKIRPPGRESGFTFSLPIPFHLAYSPTLIGPQKTVPDSTDKRKTVRNWFLWDQELERMARWKEIESWDGDYYYALSTLNLYWCAQWKEKLRRTHKDWGWTHNNMNHRLSQDSVSLDSIRIESHSLTHQLSLSNRCQRLYCWIWKWMLVWCERVSFSIRIEKEVHQHKHESRLPAHCKISIRTQF